MKMSKRYLLSFLVMLSSMLILHSCSKDSLDPEIKFKVDDSTVTCIRPEYVNAYYYGSTKKLSINGSNHVLPANSPKQEKYEIKFIIEQVDMINNIVGIDIPLESNIVLPYDQPFINVLMNSPEANFEFIDLNFKVTEFKNRRISGTFSGNVRSTSDSSVKEVLDGHFTDVFVEDMVL